MLDGDTQSFALAKPDKNTIKASSRMSRPWFAFLIEKWSTRADDDHFIAKWRITVIELA